MDIAKHVKSPEAGRIPKKVLYHYLERKLISNPLTPDDRRFLAAVEAIWTDRATLGAMLARHTTWDRELLSATWDLAPLHTRIFGYGLHGITLKGVGDAPDITADASVELVELELLRCNYPKQSRARIKQILKRADGFLHRLSKRFGLLCCPECRAELNLAPQLNKPKKLRWELRLVLDSPKE